MQINLTRIEDASIPEVVAEEATHTLVIVGSEEEISYVLDRITNDTAAEVTDIEDICA